MYPFYVIMYASKYIKQFCGLVYERQLHNPSPDPRKRVDHGHRDKVIPTTDRRDDFAMILLGEGGRGREKFRKVYNPKTRVCMSRVCARQWEICEREFCEN